MSGIPKIIAAQTDFSGGQIDASAKRRTDQEVVKSGARAMQNLRPNLTGAATGRPGRRAFGTVSGGRTEPLRIGADVDLYINFSAGSVSILNSAGGVVVTNGGYPWDATTVGSIVWCVTPTQIVMCYPGMQPQLATYSAGGGTWAFSAFAFSTQQSQVQEPFYRFSVPDATMSASAQTGSVTLECSENYFTDAMIGRVLSILGQQVTITAVGSSTPITTATATVANKLPDMICWEASAANLSTAPTAAAFQLHQVVEGATTARKGEIVALYGPTGSPSILYVYCVLMDSITYYGANGTLANEQLVSDLGQVPVTQTDQVIVGAGGPGQPANWGGTVQWQEEFMSAVAGWPSSCFFDSNRLGFCNFPQAPGAILWSEIGSYDSFWVDDTATQEGSASAGALASSAILEFLSDPVGVKFVVGEWGNEFVFTDRGVYQLPITASQPLEQANIQFVKVSDDGCGPVKPASTRESMLFFNAGLNRVAALIRTGSITTPYGVQDVTEFHSDLLKSPICISVSDGDGQLPERYAYIVNGDGSVVVGKYNQLKTFIGWVPWTSSGSVKWIAVAGANILYTTSWNGAFVAELEDATAYLDCAIFPNNPLASMAKAGDGPLWPFIPAGSVRVMDGVKDYGVRDVDGSGNLVKNPDDDFSSATLVCGAPWSELFTPFTPEAPPGQDSGQRQRRRRISRACASVQDSNGFIWGGREIPPYDWNDDVDSAPKLRERTYRHRQFGRSFDPTVSFIKDTPGPVVINEVSIEVTV